MSSIMFIICSQELMSILVQRKTNSKKVEYVGDESYVTDDEDDFISVLVNDKFECNRMRVFDTISSAL